LLLQLDVIEGVQPGAAAAAGREVQIEAADLWRDVTPARALAFFPLFLLLLLLLLLLRVKFFQDAAAAAGAAWEAVGCMACNV
jgi:hypothetical protein